MNSSDSPISPSLPNQGNDIKPNDLLAEVPDEIFSFILSFLTIRDATKARILSRRHRYICPSLLHLDFDLHTVLGINFKGSHSNGNSDISGENRCKFVLGVDQFLELYNGQMVDSLRVCFCLGNEHASHIDQWIRSAFRMKTKKLDLDFSANCRYHLYEYPWQLLPDFSANSQNKCLYEFPCQLLPEAKTSQLKHLCLRSCYLRPAPHLVGRLISLKTLDLDHVPLDQSSTESILSGCLNLEWLRLKNSIVPETFCIHSPSLHLKTLIVHDCYRVDKVEISAVGLSTFEYIGKVKKFSFLDVPHLDKVHLCFKYAYGNGTQYMFSGLANDLPQIQILSLVWRTKEVLSVPTSFSRFNYLKRLELFVMFELDFNLLSVTSLLNASPLLQKFHVSLYEGGDGDRREEHLYSKQIHNQLKEVEVHGFLGSSNEMELAIYLLNNAVSLERMILSPRRRLYHGGGKWTSSECFSFFWEPNQAYDLLLKERVNSHTQLFVS